MHLDDLEISTQNGINNDMTPFLTRYSRVPYMDLKMIAFYAVMCLTFE